MSEPVLTSRSDHRDALAVSYLLLSEAQSIAEGPLREYFAERRCAVASLRASLAGAASAALLALDPPTRSAMPSAGPASDPMPPARTAPERVLVLAWLALATLQDGAGGTTSTPARLARRRTLDATALAMALLDADTSAKLLSALDDSAPALAERRRAVTAALDGSSGAADPASPTRPVATVTPYRDGPYVLRGEFTLLDQDGREIDARRGTVALCRCGRSRMRPFCDGTHTLVGFRAPGGLETGDRRIDFPGGSSGREGSGPPADRRPAA